MNANRLPADAFQKIVKEICTFRKAAGSLAALEFVKLACGEFAEFGTEYQQN